MHREFDDPVASVRSLSDWSPDPGMRSSSSIPKSLQSVKKKALRVGAKYAVDKNMIPDSGHKVIDGDLATTTRVTTGRIKEKIHEHNKLKEELMKKLYEKSSKTRQVFRYFDVDGSGSVSRAEFQQALVRLGVPKESSEFKALLEEADKNGDGEMSYDEFVATLQRKDYDSSVTQSTKDRYKDHPAKADHLGINLSVIDYSADMTRTTEDESFVRDSRHDSVIVPVRQRSAELDKSLRRTLRAQRKAVSYIQEHAKGKGISQTEGVLKLFRACQPDDFGFIKGESFVAGVTSEIGLSTADAQKLLNLAKPDNRNQLDLLGFRRAFASLDANPVLPPASSRTTGLKIIPASNKLAPGMQRKSERAYSDMRSSREKDDFKDKRRILQVMETNKRDLIKDFKRTTSGSDYIDVRTKLNFNECSETLAKIGLAIHPNRLKELYDSDASGTITLSQLYQRTANYFDNLTQHGSDAEREKEKLKDMLYMRGEMLGCRRQGGKGKGFGTLNLFDYELGPVHAKRDRDGQAGPIFPKITSRTTGRSTARRGATERDSHVTTRTDPWKIRWVDKTVPQAEKRKLLGGAPGSDHGNIISWSETSIARPRVTDDIAHTGAFSHASNWSLTRRRPEVFEGSTGRSLDTGRVSLETSRSDCSETGLAMTSRGQARPAPVRPDLVPKLKLIPE